MALRTIAAPCRAASCLMLGVFGACYAPDLPTGAVCEDTSRCPLEQTCIAGRCRRAAEDAADPDTDSTDEPSAVDCSSSQRCATAKLVGTLSGDSGVAVTTVRNSRSTWLRVRVTENDNTVAGSPLRVQALLRSTGSATFEVRLYVNPSADVIECSTPSALPVNTGTTSAATVAWGETDLVANGNDDSRDLLIEIRALSGTCSTNGTWELMLTGGAAMSSR